MHGGMTAREAAELFCAALARHDEEAAKSACTRAGWESAVSGSAGHTFASSVRKALRIEITGEPTTAGKRVALPGTVTDVVGKPMAKLWFLVEENLSNHRIAGITPFEPYMKLYLEGRLDAVTDWTALPRSPSAEAWAGRFVTAVTGGEAQDLGANGEGLVAPLKEVYALFPDTTVEIAGSATLPGTTRHGVGIRFVSPGHAPRERWIALNGDGADLSPIRVLPALGPQLMLENLV